MGQIRPTLTEGCHVLNILLCITSVTRHELMCHGNVTDHSNCLKNEWRLRKISLHLTALPSDILLFMKHGWALVIVSSRHTGRKFQMCHGHEARLSN
jgi:hypothetical protein